MLSGYSSDVKERNVQRSLLKYRIPPYRALRPRPRQRRSERKGSDCLTAQKFSPWILNSSMQLCQGGVPPVSQPPRNSHGFRNAARAFDPRKRGLFKMQLPDVAHRVRLSQVGAVWRGPGAADRAGQKYRVFARAVAKRASWRQPLHGGAAMHREHMRTTRSLSSVVS